LDLFTYIKFSKHLFSAATLNNRGSRKLEKQPLGCFFVFHLLGEKFILNEERVEGSPRGGATIAKGLQ
jgi:hypothetical protein